MKTKMEIVLGVIRSGPYFEEHGDPYDFSCVATFEGKRAHIRAEVGNDNRQVYKDIKELLTGMGIIDVEWDKLNNSKRTLKKKTTD